MPKALKEKLQDQIQNSLCTENADLEGNTCKNIVTFENPESHVLSIAPDFAITLKEAKERIYMLQSFVQEMMIQGVGFGVIPGCNKPILLKPGAEKLCDIFGFSKKIDLIELKIGIKEFFIMN